MIGVELRWIGKKEHVMLSLIYKYWFGKIRGKIIPNAEIVRETDVLARGASSCESNAAIMAAFPS